MAFWQFWKVGTLVQDSLIRLSIWMDAFEYLTTSARRVSGFAAAGNTGNESRETDTENDEITRARRFLTLLKLVLVIIATALTIARMLGWL